MDVRKEVQRVWKAMSSRRRKAVLSAAKSSGDGAYRCRCQIVVNLAKGVGPGTIQRQLFCSEAHVYRVAHRFIEQGEAGLVDRRDENGGGKVTEHYELWLLILVAFTPQEFGRRRPTWTQELLILEMHEATNITISRSTMSRLLRKLKIRLGRPKPYVTCPWPDERKKQRLQRLKLLLGHARPNEVWVYADEVDIDLNPKIGRDYMLPGIQKKVRTPGVNKKRYLAGALNAHTGKLTWVEGESKDSELFVRLIFALGRTYPDAPRIHLILDNYGIHKSRFTRAIRASCDGRVRFHFLPPYSPDDNKIERTWEDLHGNVTRNHNCLIMNELMIEVRHWLRKETRRLERQHASAA